MKEPTQMEAGTIGAWVVQFEDLTQVRTWGKAEYDEIILCFKINLASDKSCVVPVDDRF